MKAWDIQLGDIIETKSCPNHRYVVLNVWDDGAYYASVGYIDGHNMCQSSMVVAEYGSGGTLHPDITKVIRGGEVLYPLADVTNSHNPTIPDWHDYPTEPGEWRLVATDQGRQYRDEVIYVANDPQGVLRQKIGSLYTDLLKTVHEYRYRYYGPMAPDPLTKVKPWK